MNESARPAYKHYLLYLPPFDLTDCLESRQQTLVLLLSNRCALSTYLLLASCVRLNSMDRNSVVAVSNPIPSSLRRQNLFWYCSSGTGGPSFASCHGIFISSSLAAANIPSSKIDYTLLDPKVCPTWFPSQS